MAFSRDFEVGIDLERSQPIDLDEVAAGGLVSDGEALARRRLQGRRRPDALLRFWTLKQAYIKAIGRGMRAPLADIQVSVEPTGPALLRAPGGDREVGR